jgi:hypothetical protein
LARFKASTDVVGAAVAAAARSERIKAACILFAML